jgi:hypothetical protein
MCCSPSRLQQNGAFIEPFAEIDWASNHHLAPSRVSSSSRHGGRDTLLALIRANGNILQAPGVTETELLSRWLDFVRVRYAM